MSDDIENNQGESQEPAWWLSKDTPLQGDVPEWMPSQFKSVEALATSYKELQKRMGQAPDSYDLTKGGGWMDAEHQGFKELVDMGQKMRVPGEFMDKVLESVGGYMDGFSFKPENVISALGENAQERLSTLENWGNANFGEDVFAALTDNITTAEGVLALEKIRSAIMSNETVFPGNETTQQKASTVESIQNEMRENLSKYESDPSYRADIMNRLDLATQNKK